MKAALYARVSTSDRDQDPETQLIQLWDFVRAQKWDSAGEYVDHAPATDIAGIERARRQGHRIGRPRVTDRRGFKRRFGGVLERVLSGQLSRRKAAEELVIRYATFKRLLDAEQPAGAGEDTLS